MKIFVIGFVVTCKTNLLYDGVVPIISTGHAGTGGVHQRSSEIQSGSEGPQRWQNLLHGSGDKIISVTVRPTKKTHSEQLEQHERCDSALLRRESGMILLLGGFRLAIPK